MKAKILIHTPYPYYIFDPPLNLLYTGLSIVWATRASISILQMLMNVLHPVQITVMLMQLVQIQMEILHVLVIADSQEMEQSAQVMSFS